jgi:hypothetical protein
MHLLMNGDAGILAAGQTGDASPSFPAVLMAERAFHDVCDDFEFRMRVHPIGEDAALAVVIEEPPSTKPVKGRVLIVLEREVKSQGGAIGLFPVDLGITADRQHSIPPLCFMEGEWPQLVYAPRQCNRLETR